MASRPTPEDSQNQPGAQDQELCSVCGEPLDGASAGVLTFTRPDTRTREFYSVCRPCVRSGAAGRWAVERAKTGFPPDAGRERGLAWIERLRDRVRKSPLNDGFKQQLDTALKELARLKREGR